MIRKAAAALTGLGLIGGAGSVVYNQHGDAIVTIKDKAGRTQTVSIASGGARFSCPGGTHDKVAAHDLRAGRIKLTLQQVRRTELRLERLYPDHNAPSSIVARYNALADRDHRLVTAYNAEIDAHNAIIDSDCTPD
jgi:hypothetical protein